MFQEESSLAQNDVGNPDMNPFTLGWMNSSYQQTLLPDAPWHEVSVRRVDVTIQIYFIE